MGLTLVSVIIPTSDRLESLEQVLLGFTTQNFNKELYEIIVADNCPYNRADPVIKKIKSDPKLPKIVHLKVSVQGVNKARNEGLKIATGKIIAFCDDDVVVDGSWLKDIVKGHEDYPSALAIGGRVEPIWQEEKPSWFPKKIEDYLSVVDFGSVPLKNPPWLVGANLSFKKKAFKRFGFFNESLGRKKGSFMFKDETEFLDRIRIAKEEILYLPNIKVKHHVPKSKTTLKFLFKRVFWEGRSEARADKIMDKHLAKVAFDLVKDSLFYMRSAPSKLIKKDKKGLVEIIISNVFTFGYLYQAFKEILWRRYESA